MTNAPATVWTVIALLALGTLALRYSFLGLLGRRSLPPWALRLLRYTPVAVLPGLVAPQVLLPAAGASLTGASLPDPVGIAVAVVTVAAGVWSRNVIWAMVAGGATLLALTLLL